MGHQQTLMNDTCNDAVTRPLSNGESRNALYCFYHKLFAIKDCRLTSKPPCVHIFFVKNKNK